MADDIRIIVLEGDETGQELLEQAVRTQPHPTDSFAGRTRPVQMTSAPGTARTGKHKM